MARGGSFRRSDDADRVRLPLKASDVFGLPQLTLASRPLTPQMMAERGIEVVGDARNNNS